MKPELIELIRTPHGKSSAAVRNAFLEKTKKANKRDCVFALKSALEQSEGYLETLPIIPFIASQRSRWIINLCGIKSADFDLIAEKEYLDKCLALVDRLYTESKGRIDESAKDAVAKAFAAQEVIHRIPDQLRILSELHSTPLGRRIVEISNGVNLKPETKPSPALACILMAIGAIVGLLAGPVGLIIGFVSGGILGVIISAQKSVDNAPEDEKLDSLAKHYIRELNSPRILTVLGEVNICINELLKHPEDAERKIQALYKSSGYFNALVNENGA